MIDRFTQKAREAIRLAVETAQELEHGYVGTEHLLLGLIKEETGVAAAVLAEHDVTEERVMELMERLISPAVATQVEGQIEYTPGARAVLQASYDEAVFFKAPLIGTEHILIAIIKDGKSTACRRLSRRVRRGRGGTRTAVRTRSRRRVYPSARHRPAGAE